eukprot:TRINITY_DN4316_c0_g1_i1.p2 TRINITY_DN4316_c0_g1~~TRINITY_DN4316_c0_g1_i1.p2  ORF type:complete len:225 (-),score=80.69 TRINITY_DN4316_c0_g1_i1:98-679(-)
MPKKSSKKVAYPTHNLVVAGGGGSGKSALTQMFIYGNFIEEYDPTTCDNYSKLVEMDGQKYQLEIMDTAGQEEILKNTHKSLGDGYMIVYSIIERHTFEVAQKFHENILNIAGFDIYPTVLVGSKFDLSQNRQISEDEGKALANKWSCSFLEASSKTKTNVDEAFFELIRVVNKWKIDHPKTKEPQKRNCLLM